MSRRIVIANQKGGVGKSTTVLNVGRALNEQGHSVMLIDLDPQAGLTASLGLDPYDLRRSSYSLLMFDNVPLGRVVRNISDQLLIVPATNSLVGAEIKLASSPNPTRRLRDALNGARIEVDYILIDTPPTLGILTLNGLIAAYELVVPVQCQFLALRGVRGTLESLEQISQRLNPKLHLMGILATMYEVHSPTSREAVEEMRTVFGDMVFQTLIGRAEVVAEAPITGQSVLDYAPQHAAAYAYRALAQEIVNRGETS